MDKILALVKEGLEAWKVFVSTRQEAYERKMDKRKEKALNIAEDSFDAMDDIFNFVFENSLVPSDKLKELGKLKEKLFKLKTKFNRYD